MPASAKQLLFVNQPYPNHNGGMVAYGRDGLVYVGMGDGGSGGDPENRAQDPSSLLGKILRLDPARPGVEPVIVALGVRNPWRFSFDRANGDLWIGDVGQGSIEEVDHVAWPLQGLLNFGWDVYEGRASFESKAARAGRLVAPVAQYTHARGCSITGGYVYRGSAVPAATGRYFYGDYCCGTVWSLKLAAVSRVRSDGAVHRPEPDVVRRGRGGRAVRRLRGRRDLHSPRGATARLAAERLQAMTPIVTPIVSMSDVVPGAVAPPDEVLVDLVADRVEAPTTIATRPPERAEREARRGRRTRSGGRACAGRDPRCRGRCRGSESTRSAKITAAQRTTGAHARKRLVGTVR